MTGKIVLSFLGIFVFAACANQPTPEAKSTRKLPETYRTPASSPSQKIVDDECFVEYSQAAGLCNQSAGDDDVAFSKCLKPVKASLRKCCQSRGGSDTCAAEAAPISKKTKKAIDDKCFADYSQAAGRCNETAGDDDSVFDKCLEVVKSDLKSCCSKNGGSKQCAAEAQPRPAK